MSKLAVIIPWTLDWIPRALLQSLWESDIPRDALLICNGSYDVSVSRNRAILDSLEWGADEILLFDADQVFPKEIYRKLHDADKDIISGLVPHSKWPHHFCVFRDVPGQMKECAWVPAPGLSRPAPVKKAGGGCLLIKRKVFETLERPWFVPIINKDYTAWDGSEDFVFCKKATAAGFEIWAHPDVFVIHSKMIHLDRTFVEKTQRQAMLEQMYVDARDFMQEAKAIG